MKHTFNVPELALFFREEHRGSLIGSQKAIPEKEEP
jgi:hypothetical protein